MSRPERASAAVIESTGGIDFRPEFASMGARLLGFIVDSLVVGVLMLPGVALLITGGSGLMKFLGVVLAVVGIIVASALYGRSVSRTGRWIGGRIAGTTVVDVRNGSMLSTSSAAARFLARHVPAVLVLPLAMALFDSQHRAFHDHLVSSGVTRPARETWSIGDDSA